MIEAWAVAPKPGAACGLMTFTNEAKARTAAEEIGLDVCRVVRLVEAGPALDAADVELIRGTLLQCEPLVGWKSATLTNIRRVLARLRELWPVR